MNWQLNILGANSAVPTRGRYPTAQVLEIEGDSILMDCGEGSQIRMLEYKIRRSRIQLICISHLHGDHVFGLPGLLTTYNLYGRVEPLTIIGPKGIEAFIHHTIEATGHRFSYDINYIELEMASYQEVYSTDKFKVTAFPLVHRIPTFGYRIEAVYDRIYLNKEKIQTYALSDRQIQQLLKEAKVEVNNSVYPLSFFEREKPKLSYGFVSDTQFFPACADYVKEVTVLYHESTFLQQEEDLAWARFHSTAEQAANIAHEAKVQYLILGHYSSRYESLESFRQEAQSIFPDVYLARTGKQFSFNGKELLECQN